MKKTGLITFKSNSRRQLPQKKISSIQGLVLLAISVFIIFSPLTALSGTLKKIEHSDSEISALFDGMITAYMREKGIAGATLSVVRDNRIITTRGYGYADLEKRVTVDPSKTLFMIGSVTKLFTWTAVMQLVEQGIIDLHADINEYLDFEIADTFSEPITMYHLLTHTPGFEDDIRNLFGTHPDQIYELDYWLKNNQPRRIMPPGQFAVYSNYGTALAGYIVQRVSGMSWEDYVETHILAPLDMNMTAVHQPVPEKMEGYLSRGYSRSGSSFKFISDEYIIGGAPGGAMRSTAGDMASFMKAHLNRGSKGNVSILRRDTADEMQSQHFTHDPRLPGMCLGFIETSSHGVRIIGHSGGTAWFNTILVLMPEHNFGFFVSFNTDSAMPLPIGSLLHSVLDNMFPEPAPAAEKLTADELKAFAGTYRFMRMSYSTFQKIIGLGMSISIKPDNGGLSLRSPLFSMRVLKSEPMLFHEDVGAHRIAFRADDKGHITHAFLSAASMMPLEKVPWYGSSGLHIFILAGGLLLFIIIIPFSIRSIVRVKKGTIQPPPSAIRAAGAALLGAAVFNLLFFLLLPLLAHDFWAFLSGNMTAFKTALILPVAGLIFALAASGAAGISWKQLTGGLWTRIRFTAGAGAALVFSWSLYYWNLLGWHF